MDCDSFSKPLEDQSSFCRWWTTDYHLDSLPQFPLQPLSRYIRSSRHDPQPCRERI